MGCLPNNALKCYIEPTGFMKAQIQCDLFNRLIRLYEHAFCFLYPAHEHVFIRRHPEDMLGFAVEMAARNTCGPGQIFQVQGAYQIAYESIQ